MKKVNKFKKENGATAKIKVNANNMNIEDLKWFNNGVAIGLSFIQIFNICIIVENMMFVKMAKIILVIMILNLVAYLVSNRNNPIKSLHIYGMLYFNLSMFTIYIFYLNFINIYGVGAKIMLIANYFIVQLVIFIKRIVIKNDKYISAVKQCEANRYFLNDGIVCVILSVIIFICVKIMDRTPIFVIGSDLKMNIIGVIFTIIIAPFIGVIIVGSWAKYKYAIKGKNS